MAVDATTFHSILSFMDGFRGYNQIKMDLCMPKRLLCELPRCNFHYTVILFSLKNTGVTYQLAIFHDMLHECLENYVNSIILKLSKVSQHINYLRKVFLIQEL